MIILLICLLAATIAAATALFPVPDPSAWADQRAKTLKM